MFSQYKIFGLTGLLCVGLASPLHADAAEISKTMFLDPSVACQLAVPTVDTAVRPRATGYRNEGTNNAFVICGIAYNFSFTGTPSITMNSASFDGAAHAMNCTGVTRQSGGGGPVYVVKAVTMPAYGSSITKWTDAEFGNINGFAYSMTCILPPGASITGIRMSYVDSVGA